MADKFFTQTRCDRCHGPLDSGRTMSRFNTQCLCMACDDEEREHPDYRKAADAELEAVKCGNRNFPGVGWPGKNGRLK